MDFRVLQGDIAQQEADALVNAAGTSLEMGSGVAGALLDAANGPLERDAVARGQVELGDVIVTDTYDLDGDYVIHAAAMSHSGPHPIATAEDIREATQKSLKTADDPDCESLVPPLFGVVPADSTRTKAHPSSATRSGRTNRRHSKMFVLSPTRTGSET